MGSTMVASVPDRTTIFNITKKKIVTEMKLKLRTIHQKIGNPSLQETLTPLKYKQNWSTVEKKQNMEDHFSFSHLDRDIHNSWNSENLAL